MLPLQPPSRPRRALAAAALAALALLAARAPRGAAQFTQLTADFLANTADPADGFGAEDKMAVCNGHLVFIDLDPDVANVWRYRYRPLTNAWTKDPLTASACPDLGQGALIPRETGYVVGVTAGPDGSDRLLVLGGASTTIEPRHIENNVYYSDDCGLTWACYDGQQAWAPREFAAVAQAKGVLPYSPAVMLGGVSTTDTSTGLSIAFFLSYDGGIQWSRPECATVANCRNVLAYADAFGRCVDEYAYYKHCYTIPDVPALSGSLTADWSTLYIHYEPTTALPAGAVYYLNASNFATGWLTLPGAAFGGLRGGRKVFIRGSTPGAGCFVSADYLAEDLWVRKAPDNSFVSSTNAIQVAATAAGPWRAFTAPWAPRAAGALVSGSNVSVAYYGSGMTFRNGAADPSGPTYGDVWRIDASVCLLAPNAQVCSGNGVADLASVTCRCAAGFSGAFCEQGSGANAAAGGLASSPAATAGGIIGVVVAVIAALVVYNRRFAGRIPQIDGVARRVDEGVAAAVDAAGSLASEAVRRARSISGGGSAGMGGTSAGASPGKGPGLLGGGGGSGSSPGGGGGGYGAL